MRHNKLAGTRFLLGSRKHKPSTFTLSSTSKNTSKNTSNNTSNSGITADCNCGNTNTGTTTNNMLHSKSTYFYRWFRESLDLVVSGLSTKKTNKVSKASKTSKASYLVPAVCGAALLGVLGFIINPMAGKTETAHAAEGSSDKCMNGDDVAGVCPMELSLTMSGTNGTGAYEEAGATPLEIGKTTYRSYGFKVSATDIDKDGYKLYATAVETKLGEIDLTNQLVNADYPDKETFIPISTTEGIVGENITAGQWGYAIAGGGTGSTLPTVDTANTNPGSLTYKAVPTNQTTPIASGTETTTTDSGIPDNPATVPDEYRLIFGAKADEGMASGHYRTQVMLSLVADPKNVPVGLGRINKMSELTNDVCKNTPTPAVDARPKDIVTKRLIDDREGENGTKYWVAKLADGNCWMTQNMMYDADAKSTDYKNRIIEPGKITYTEIGSRIPSDDPLTALAFPDDATYNAHYQIGNYYNFSQAQTVCNSLGDGWKTPASNGNNIGTFGGLITKYAVGSNWEKLTAAPLYFVAGGEDNNGVGTMGGYWSSVWTSTTNYYYLWFSYNSSDSSKSNINPSFTHNPDWYGDSVRCLVSGV